MRPVRDERGAAMVLGLCFAVFLTAAVFYVLAIAETVLFRERMQDAADTAAFSAAVVNARGMNLIALINMVMAIVLSILVSLRLAQTLCMVAIALCLALAWPTGGSTLQAVGPLTNASVKIQRVIDRIKDPINNALAALHAAGKVTSVVVPIGSNVRVLDQTAAYYGAAGVAVPSRLTLPVEDDDFSVLCEHAGEVASRTALLPIAMLLPNKVERGLGDVVGKIAAAGSSWFCGKGGNPPDFNDDSDAEIVELPRFPAEERCEAHAAQSKKDSAVDVDEVDEVCQRAAVERLMSVPNRRGRAREGEPLCPTNCQHSNRDNCPPKTIADCPADEAARIADAGVRFFGSARVWDSQAPDSPYNQRRELAREQCRPYSEGGRRGLKAYWWLERRVIRTYRWDDVARTWREQVEARQEFEETFVERKKEDSRYPCGRGGEVGEAYERDGDKPVCIGRPRCQYANGAFMDVACSRAAPRQGMDKEFREETTEVTAILRCAYERETRRVETPSMDISKEMGKQSESSGQNTSPFRLEQDVYLGGSDFQLRAVVLASLPKGAREAVGLARWGEGLKDFGVATGLRQLGRIALSQAEFYFDWSGIDPSLDDETDQHDRTEWLWHMGWRARLRPFRLHHAEADAERANGHQGFDSEQQRYLPAGGETLSVGALDCQKLGDICGDAKALLADFGAEGG